MQRGTREDVAEGLQQVGDKVLIYAIFEKISWDTKISLLSTFLSRDSAPPLLSWTKYTFSIQTFLFFSLPNMLQVWKSEVNMRVNQQSMFIHRNFFHMIFK